MQQYRSNNERCSHSGKVKNLMSFEKNILTITQKFIIHFLLVNNNMTK